MNRDPQTDAEVYPFSAIVDQTAMKRALTLAAIHPGLGGVLIRGSKGAAKSTAVRALTALLPAIEVYPRDPFRRAPGELVDGWPLEDRLTPARSPVAIVDLPVGSTEDRVVGSLNLERALGTGARVFEPGLLASAHRGILYIDEVNLLGDHLVDLLLDAAAMGVNHVEREGLAFRHPSRFLLVGTMNPEEGDLRPQLLDRFGLTVDVEPMNDPARRAEIVRRRLAFESDPAGFRRTWAEADRREGERVAAAQRLLPEVKLSDAILNEICGRCAREGAEGLRADITIYKAATALAAYHGRTAVTTEDVDTVAELALAHRRTTVNPAPPPPAPRPPSRPRDEQEHDPSPRRQDRPRIDYADGGRRDESHISAHNDVTAQVGDRDDEASVLAPSELRTVVVPAAKSDRMSGQGRRRSSRQAAPAHGRQGAFVRSVPPVGRCADPAIHDTLRASAPLQVARGRASGGPLILRRHDLREKVRKSPPRHLVILTVDASRSMGARRRMAATKGAVLSLLVDAYQKRDLVGLVRFGGTGASVVVAPTRSVRTAARCMADLPVGGLTPLAHGLITAAHVIALARRRDPALRPLVILLTDGRGNVPLVVGGDPIEDAHRAVRRFEAEGTRGLVIDTEEGPVRLGQARELAAAWRCPVRALDGLSSAGLPEAIRRVLLAG